MNTTKGGLTEKEGNSTIQSWSQRLETGGGGHFLQKETSPSLQTILDTMNIMEDLQQNLACHSTLAAHTNFLFCFRFCSTIQCKTKQAQS